MEKPILFSTDMVRAILAGVKTQTRRVIKPQPTVQFDGTISHSRPQAIYLNWNEFIRARCPYGRPGDVLWVRETWRVAGWDDNGGLVKVQYKADGSVSDWIELENDWDGERFMQLWQESSEEFEDAGIPMDEYDCLIHVSSDKLPTRWRPAIHMSREMARLCLRVKNVRVERVQDITEENAKAEGVEFWDAELYRKNDGCFYSASELSPVDRFHALWDQLNAKRGYGWDINPWVFVISFEVRGEKDAGIEENGLLSQRANSV